MSEYLKSECPHCGQSVEYPAEGTGQAVPCPTCGKPISLVPVGIALPREPQRSDPKYNAWDGPAGKDYGYSLDHMRWAAEVKQKAERAQQIEQLQAELARAKQSEKAAGELRWWEQAQVSKSAPGGAVEPHAQRTACARCGAGILPLTAERNHGICQPCFNESPQGPKPAPRTARQIQADLERAKQAEMARLERTKQVEMAKSQAEYYRRLSDDAAEKQKQAEEKTHAHIAAEPVVITQPSKKPDDHAPVWEPVASEIQKNKLRFFCCTWNAGITVKQARSVIDDHNDRFPLLAAAYNNHPATPEQLDALCQHGITAQSTDSLSYARANEMLAERENNYGGTVYANQQGALVKPTEGASVIRTSAIAAQRLETLLADLETSGNCSLPVAEAAKLLDITAEAKLGIKQCRQIAATLESIGYCVEPDARYAGGSYAWTQSLGVFKRIPGDRVTPSPGYIGAANLLRLCLLIAAADGRIDEEELDVFRQIIENQLDLSQTDHCRLLILERMLAVAPASAVTNLAKIARSVQPHKKLLIGRVVVRVAAADRVITEAERRALERIFKALEIPPEALENLLAEACPPPQAVRAGASCEQIPERLTAPSAAPEGTAKQDNGRTNKRGIPGAVDPTTMFPWLPKEFSPGYKPEGVAPATEPADPTKMFPWLPSEFKPHQPKEPAAPQPARELRLDMAKVESITKDTREVVELLSAVMDEEAEQAESLPPTTTGPTAEVPGVSGSAEPDPSPLRFTGLDAAFHPILARLLSRGSWPQADFQALAREFHVMPLKIHDTLNEWADDALGDFILEGEDPVVIRRELITKGMN